MTLIDRLSKLDGPDREAELLRMYQDEKQRADCMSDDWVNFCNYIGIDLDTQEAVAEAINTARHKDQVEHNELVAKLEASEKARDDSITHRLKANHDWRVAYEALEIRFTAAKKVRETAIELDEAVTKDFNVFGAQQKLRTALEASHGE
ncbi:hypothetical protein ACJKIH_14645 [Brucella pseudogrignonensis]|uniref:hypothetical protein n=1 Tax=Brucella pseudogrignonensis TaxID=419475 RepID=UPI0038B5042D